MIVTTTNLFAVRSELPVKSMDELVAYAKSNPGKLSHGASLGVPPHLLGEFVRAKTGRTKRSAKLHPKNRAASRSTSRHRRPANRAYREAAE